MRGRVIIDTLGGQALLGNVCVKVAEAGSNGELEIEGGTILRPITFGQRTRISARASLSPTPRENCAAGVLSASTVRAGTDDTLVLEVLAMVLAGADESGFPFAETTLTIARAAGWSHADIAGAEAADIDRLARHLSRNQPDDGWTRLVFDSPPSQELADIRDALANNLLERVDSTPLGDRVGIGPRGMAPPGAANPSGEPRRVPEAFEGASSGEPSLSAEDLPVPGVYLGSSPPASPMDNHGPLTFRMRLQLRSTGGAPLGGGHRAETGSGQAAQREGVSTPLQGSSTSTRESRENSNMSNLSHEPREVSPTRADPPARDVPDPFSEGRPALDGPRLNDVHPAGSGPRDAWSGTGRELRRSVPGGASGLRSPAGGIDAESVDGFTQEFLGAIPEIREMTVKRGSGTAAPTIEGLAPADAGMVALDAEEIADALAALLNDEADLRGIDP